MAVSRVLHVGKLPPVFPKIFGEEVPHFVFPLGFREAQSFYTVPRKLNGQIHPMILLEHAFPVTCPQNVDGVD